jgi:hypothetical protein
MSHGCNILLNLLHALASLPANVFIHVANSLALIWLGAAIRADLGGELPDLLLVDSTDGDFGVFLDLDFEAGRNWVLHRVRIPELEVEELPFDRCTIA